MLFLIIATIVATILVRILVHAWKKAEAKARRERIEYRRKLEEGWYKAQARQVQLFIR